MRIHVIPKQLLDKLLATKQEHGYRPESFDLKGMLKGILLQANRFVPSESGSILIDDSALGRRLPDAGMLYFVACFGKGSAAVTGATLAPGLGIAGSTYSSGRPYISKQVMQDSRFYPKFDKMTKYKTQSIICAPIKMRGGVIGVIELINKSSGINYVKDDLTLLKIFAEYTSTLIQNALDAKSYGELSIRDNLTGLYNDRYIFDRLEKEVSNALRKKTGLSVIFMDLDRFKEINDSHGHLIGSRVLTEIGHILFALTRKANGISARYGGDEFTVILPDKDIEAAAQYAEKIRKTIEDCTFVTHKSRGIKKALNISGIITASLGVASLRTNIEGKGSARVIGDSLIRLADAAMYQSKADGKNRVTLARKKFVLPVI